MKKMIAILMMLCLLCGPAMAESASRILIAYVSRAGENYNVGVTDPDSASAAYAGYVEKGNTQIVAETIAELTGGDLYQITTVEPYPDDYASMLTRAQEELDTDARPELAGGLPDPGNHTVEMDGDAIKDEAKQREGIKTEWGEYVATTNNQGNPPANPPRGSSTMTKQEILAIKDTAARQNAIAANLNLFKR